MLNRQQRSAQERTYYLERLNEITNAVIGTLDFQDMLQTLAVQLRELFDGYACHIALWDDLKQMPIPAAATGPTSAAFLAVQVKPGQKTLTDTVLQLGRVLAVPDVFDSAHLDQDIATLFPNNRALLAIPLIAAEQKLGAAIVTFNEVRRFSDQELVWSEQVSAPIALAIARARLLDTERTQRELAETLHEAASALSTTLEFDTLLDRLLGLIANLVPYDTAAFIRVEQSHATIIRHRGYAAADTTISGTTFDLHDTPNLRRLAESRRAMIIPDTRQAETGAHFAAFAHVRSWIGVPVIIRDELFGLFSLEKREPGFYKETYLDRLISFANQAALSLSNAHLHAETKRQLTELTALHAVATAGTAATNEDELIGMATDIIGNALYPDHVGLLIYDEAAGALRPHPSYHPPNALLTRDLVLPGQGVSGQVFVSGQAQCIGDVLLHPNYISADTRTRSELCVPLRVHGRIIGVINIESQMVNTFTTADERLLTTIAGQLASAIERLRLFASERGRRQEAETLRNAIAAVTSSLELDQVLETILVQLRQVLPYDSAALMLLDQKQLTLVAGQGFPAELLPRLLGQVFDADNELVRELYETRLPICMADVREDARFQHWGGVSYIRGWMGLPLLARGEVIGFLTVDNRLPNAYQPSDIALAQAFANQAATAIANARLYEAAQSAQQAARRQARELQVTAEIVSLLNGTPHVTEILPRLAVILVQVTACDRVSLLRLDAANRQQGTLVWLNEPHLTPLPVGTQIRLEDSSAAENVIAGRCHLTPDLTQEASFKIEKLLVAAGFRSRLNLPLRIGAAVTGALNLTWRAVAGYDVEQLPMLQQIADALALALERTRLFENLNQRTLDLELLIGLSTRLREAGSVADMLPQVLDAVSQITTVHYAAVFLRDSDRSELVARAVYPAQAQVRDRRVPLNQGVTGHVARTGSVYLTDDLKTDPYVHVYPEELADLEQIGGSITLPLQAQTRVLGVLHVALARQVRLQDSEVRLLTAVAEIAGSALDRAVVLETLEQRVVERTQELATANERLQELDRLKSKFVSDISHELRTPITNLKLYLDLLARGKAERQAHYLDVLQQQAQRLNELVEGILNLARLEIVTDDTRFTRVALNDLVLPIVTVQQPRAEMAGLKLSCRLDPDLPPVWGDSTQLSQVVSNLVSNAIRYTRDGQIAILTSWHPETNAVCLTVADTGIGIHPDEQSYLFDRFYRGRQTGQSNIPGTGLGLAIVKEILDRHQGRIEVQSEPGKGSTFRVWLIAAFDHDAGA